MQVRLKIICLLNSTPWLCISSKIIYTDHCVQDVDGKVLRKILKEAFSTLAIVTDQLN